MRKSIGSKAAWLGGALAGLAFVSAPAADLLKEDNADDLNLGTSWVGGVPPAATEIAVWGSAVLSDNATLLGANLEWLGLRLADPGGPVTINDSGSTLTLGAAGIDLSTALQDLTLQTALSLGAAQNWSVGTDRTLSANGVVSGAAASALTKSGDGRLVLGGANSYAGGTRLTGGVLQVNTATSAGAGPIQLSGGTLVYNPAAGINIANLIEIVAGTTNMIVVTSGSGGNPISSGAWSGAGTVLISNTFNPYTVNASLANFSGTIVLVTPLAGGQFRFNSGGGNPNTGSPNALFDLGAGAASLRSRNATTINLGAVRGGPGTTLAGRSSGSGGSTIFSVGAKNLDTVFAGVIANGGDATAIAKVGTGKWTLTGANTYTGGTTVNDGALEIGDGDALGSLGPGPVLNNARLVFNRGDEFEVPNALSGSGVVIKTGQGVMTFDGTNTSSGTLRLEQGTLILGPVGAVSGPIFLAEGATLDVTAAASFVLSQNLSGLGTVVGLLTAGLNGILSPAGNGVPGALNLAGGLVLTDGATCRFDLSDDPTGLAKPNDLIHIDGDFEVAGRATLMVAALNGSVPPGTYKLIRYTGVLRGVLEDLLVSGVSGTLVDRAGEIALVVSATRPPAELTWLGDGAGNFWDEHLSANWLNGGKPDQFVSGDRVRFDAHGAANPVVNLAGVVSPADMLVDAAGDYTLTGSGRISGTGGLLKTNAGTLSLDGAHDYTGPTVLGGGVLAVSQLANGASPSGVGAASGDPTNLVINGATLRYVGPTAGTDRGATLLGPGGTIDVAAEEAVLTASGFITGPGALTKSGPGVLTLAAANTYTGGIVIREGTLALGSQAANSAAGLSGLGPTNCPVTFNGGILELFGFDGGNNVNYNTVFNPLVVPAGQTGTLRLFQRGPTDNTGLRSPLTGAGALELVVSYLRGSLDGDWSAFAGQITVSVKPGVANAHLRINNTAGYPQAALFLNDGVNMYRNGGADATTEIGELTGAAASVVGWGTVAQNQAAANPTWRVGIKNTSATFDGAIINDGVTSVTKAGAGAWTLTGTQAYSGATRIEGGVLALSGNGAISASTNLEVSAGAVLDVTGRADQLLTLNAGQTLSGDGQIHGDVVVAAGSTVSPGANAGEALGRLSFKNRLLLQEGSVTRIDWSRARQTNDLLDLPAGISFAGELHVVGAFTGGERLKIFTGLREGGFGAITPDPPGPGLGWDASALLSEGLLKVVGSTPLPTLSAITVGEGRVDLSGSGGYPEAGFFLLTTTNLDLPMTQWTVIATNAFDPGGLFSFPLEWVPDAPQRFYRLQYAP